MKAGFLDRIGIAGQGAGPGIKAFTLKVGGLGSLRVNSSCFVTQSTWKLDAETINSNYFQCLYSSWFVDVKDLSCS